MATPGEREDSEKKIHKWTPDQVRYLIRFRTNNKNNFTKKKNAAKTLWEKLIKELDLEGKVTTAQVSKKWENLKKLYKSIIDPLSPVSSPGTQEESTENTLEEASTSTAPSPATSNASNTAASAGSASDPPPSGASSKRASGPLPSPSPKKKRRNPVLDYLKEESAKEQQRHEESEAKTDRFLSLFEKLVNKIPDKQ